MKIVWFLIHGFMAFLQSGYYLKRNLHKLPEYVFYLVIYIIWFVIPEGIVHLAKWCWERVFLVIYTLVLAAFGLFVLIGCANYLDGYQSHMMIAINTDDIYLAVDQLKQVEDYLCPQNVWSIAGGNEKAYIMDMYVTVHELRVELEEYANDEWWLTSEKRLFLYESMRDFQQIREAHFLWFSWIKVTPVPDLAYWPMMLDFKSSGITGAGAAYSEDYGYFHGLIPPQFDSARSA